MKTFGRLLQISFFVALLFATVATISVAGQATTSTADQSTAYPAEQAPPPPADQPATSSSGQQVDPPGRVARLEYMTGSVSVQPHGTDEWVQGSANRPLTIADNVWADKDSRAELNLGTGLLRIGSETSLTLTNVTNDTVQVQLHQGTLNLHLRKLYGGEIYEIDTPNQAFTVTKSGEYRVDVDPTGDATLVTVWKGEGEATGQGPAVRVHEGQQARFTSGNSLEHQIKDAPNPDGFDEWCKVRDKREDQSVSARYVAPGVVGASDLDEYGSWRDTPDYGHVWVPTSVAPGWAPYRNGHWAWVDPWGWTWVDDAPWGFAPFHYGRWVDFDGYWGWAPGPYWVRPYYAPALVAWYGGSGFGFGFGFGGGFGWCPLGFGEPFFPWYGVSRGYFRNVNISNTRITNITNITNNYYNTRARGGGFYGRNGIATPRYLSKPGAFTAVSHNTLQRGLPVAPNAARISPGALRNVASIGRPNVTPTREAMLGPKAAARPSLSTASRPTFSRMTPPAMSLRPAAAQPAARNFGNPAARNNPMPTARRPEGRPASMTSNPASAGRFIPRPPASLGNSRPGSFGRGLTAEPARSRPTQIAMNRDIPRPPQGGVRSLSQPNLNARSGMPSASPLSRSVPRPPQGSFTRPSMTTHNIAPYNSPRSYGSPSFGRSMPSSVPHPTGRITPAPRDYPAARSQGNYSARSNGGNGYGGYRGYSAPPSSGSYGGRSYSAPPSHSYGSYGGGRGYSAPSRSYGSYGGGSYSAPSSRSYGGYSGGSASHGSSGYHGSSGGSSGSRGGHSGR
jgi:hypothetical protein